MTGPAPKLATFADLAALGADDHHEILGGRLTEKAAPRPEHGRAQRVLSRFVGGPFDDDDGRGGPGGWWILTEVDVELFRHDVVRPDIAGFRRERCPDPWGRRPIRVVPDWICEVLSPSDESRDRVHKTDLYAHAGVPHFWLVDPTERFLEAFELRDGRWSRLGAFTPEQAVRIPPFDAIELEIGRLFPPE